MSNQFNIGEITWAVRHQLDVEDPLSKTEVQRIIRKLQELRSSSLIDENEQEIVKIPGFLPTKVILGGHPLVNESEISSWRWASADGRNWVPVKSEWIEAISAKKKRTSYYYLPLGQMIDNLLKDGWSISDYSFYSPVGSGRLHKLSFPELAKHAGTRLKGEVFPDCIFEKREEYE